MPRTSKRLQRTKRDARRLPQRDAQRLLLLSMLVCRARSLRRQPHVSLLLLRPMLLRLRLSQSQRSLLPQPAQEARGAPGAALLLKQVPEAALLLKRVLAGAQALLQALGAPEVAQAQQALGVAQQAPST
jgi:hypothetical protein